MASGSKASKLIAIKQDLKYKELEEMINKTELRLVALPDRNKTKDDK